MRFRVPALALAALWLFACGAEPEAPAPAESAARSEPVSGDGAVETAAAETEKARPTPRGRPLPAFSGWTLDDERLDISTVVGKRVLLYFFNPEVREALAATRAMNAIAPLRGKHNFEIVGIAVGAPRDSARTFARDQGVEFRVIDDSSARLAQQFGLRSPVAVIAADAEGYVTFGSPGFGSQGDVGIQSMLREALRLPPLGGEQPSRTEAPAFRATPMDGDLPFELAAHRGEPVVLIFFLHTCPHCHAALRSIKEVLDSLPEDGRPLLVGIEVTGKTHAVRQLMQSEGLDFFPVYFDDDGRIQAAYGVFGAVPDIFLIDREGRLRERMQAWEETRDEPLMRMRLAKLTGAPIPMLLRSQGYSGSEVCGVCHELEHETWNFTSHASAFDTLVKHGAENDAECVGCHVVGWEQSGGFRSAPETPDLEDVGCESCHGRGGPHLSPGFVADAQYEPACVTCHDTKHSLGFEYSAFVPRISHVENASLVALSPEEKARILAERGRPGGALLPTSAEYVGSDACRECHTAEFDTWAASSHAHAVATLETKGKTGDAACLACHTTGFGRPGGFPEGSAPAAPGSDLARVGCESCHGPGGAHVAENATRIGTIVSLGDKCDSCVILQICGSCHDDANDPGFEFEVLEKIERQRHGTIEPGTGRPKEATAATDVPGLAETALASRSER